MARPSKLTQARQGRIIEQLRDGVPFATACRTVGVSPSAGYEWLYRGWGTHPDRPPAARYVAFAQAVDAVFPGGFAERHEDEDEFAERHAQARPATNPIAGPENRRETGDAPANPSESQRNAEFAEPGFPDTPRDRARAREEESDEEPGRRAPMPWRSKSSRGSLTRGIVEREF